MTRKNNFQKVLYVLVDTETTKRNGLVFDCAYKAFDRKGRQLAYGSFLFKNVMAVEEPFYKEKIALYWKLVEKGKIRPVSFRAFRKYFNLMLQKFVDQGYRIILMAYNAEFDTRVLGTTTKALIGPDEKFLSVKVELFDLMHGWAVTCPAKYGETAPFSPKGNLRTTAETVYRFESGDQSFVEAHVAYADIKIEEEIFKSILRRKKKLHIVDNPKKFVAQPWRVVQERCKRQIAARQGERQMVMDMAGINLIPAYTVSKDHKRKANMEDRAESFAGFRTSEPSLSNLEALEITETVDVT